MDGLTEYRLLEKALWRRAPGSRVDGRHPLQRITLEADAHDGIARDHRGAYRQRIDCVRWTPLHQVAMTGGCRIGTARYLYRPGDDALVLENGGP